MSCGALMHVTSHIILTLSVNEYFPSVCSKLWALQDLVGFCSHFDLPPTFRGHFGRRASWQGGWARAEANSPCGVLLTAGAREVGFPSHCCCGMGRSRLERGSQLSSHQLYTVAGDRMVGRLSRGVGTL